MEFENRSAEANVDSEMSLLKTTQKLFFEEEINCLKTGKPCQSYILQLNPFLDDNGVLKVVDRLNSAELRLKNPIIVQGKFHVVKLLIEHFHQKVMHKERLFTESAVRNSVF